MAGLLVGIAATAGGIIVVGSRSNAQDRSTLPAGPIPDQAYNASGELDPALVPALVSATDDSGAIVGYIRRSDLFPSEQRTGAVAPRAGAVIRADVHEVWDHTGTKLLGHFYPDGVGFISLTDERTRRVSPEHPPTSKSTGTTIGD